MADRHPSYPATLKELFDELGQKALEGASQADILHWLLGFAKWYGFRLRYDEYQVGEYDPELVEERTREAVALWEARRTQRTAAPAAAKSSAPVLESKTYEEYLAELAAAKKPAAAPAADDSVPESATDDSGTKSATEPPADDSGTEPPADDFVPKAPARQRSGRKRGEAVTVQIRRGRLSVKDPAIRAPRDPPTYTSAIARSDGGRGGSDSRTATSSRNSTRGRGGRQSRDQREIPSNLFTYLRDGDAVIGRVLLFRENRAFRARGRPRPIENEFGSLTIDAITWRPLAITPRPFANKIPKGAVNDYIAKDLYEIVRTNDGSLGTLYRWWHVREGPIWCLATQRGYDVFPLTWSGGRTWAEALHDLLTRERAAVEPGDGAGQVGFELTKDRLCEGDCRIEFTELDEGRCYTINMRDHGLQPLLNDPPAIWSVQSVALRGDSDFQPSFDIGVPSFPKQKVMTLPELQGAVRERLPDEGPEVTVAALRQLCDSSIEDAIRAIREGRTGFDHFHYGFILRSRSHGETGDVSDIIIESPLLNRVRHHMYSPPSQSSPDAKRITTHNRLRFFALRSLLLNEASREEILALFPQFTELDSKAREFLNNVQHYVLEHSRRRASRPEKQSAGASPPAAPHRSSVACLGDEVLRAVYREFPNFNGFERGVAEATIRGYVHDAQNAMFVLAAIGLA